MRRIDVTESDAGLELVGDNSDADFVLASEDDVTFPAVWLEGERIYDVEIWRDVDAAFDEHESRRSS
jgi:hypothetical protein